MTFDVRAIAPKVPVIGTLALGFTFDSTAGLVTQRLNGSCAHVGSSPVTPSAARSRLGA